MWCPAYLPLSACVNVYNSWCICCPLHRFSLPQKDTLGDAVLYTPARHVLPKGRQQHHIFLVVSEAELPTEVTGGWAGAIWGPSA